MRLQQAFSLIEMMIVIFIISITAAIMVPSLRDFIDRHEDEKIQWQLLHAIQLARKEARIRHMPIGLCQSQNDLHCTIEGADQLIFIDENEDGMIRDQEQILAVIQIPMHGNLHWRSFPRYRHYLQFIAIGTIQNDNGTFWYCRTSQPAWAMMLSQSGRTRVVYPDKNGMIKDSHGKKLSC